MQATQPSPAVALTRFIHKIDGALDFVYRFRVHLRTLLLLLGIYITYQVIVRKLGGPVLGNQELHRWIHSGFRGHLGVLVFAADRISRAD